MPASENLLDDLADAVLDGGVVDWAAAESSAGTDTQSVVSQLRLLASIARLHRDPASQAEQLTPDRWGHLRLLERVGRGAFGEVYRAWDTPLDREVALKLLPADPSSDPHASTIIREGRLLAKVRHPNVVTIHGAEQIGNQIGLSMEFVRGQTLEQLLRQGTVFSGTDVIHIGLELARAVSAVHAAGLLHRDIKAQNVTRAEDGRIVLMDFGTGREVDDDSSPDLAGTPLYLAPEVLAGGPATVQSDIYSLGVLLYYLVAGSYPVQCRTIREMRYAHERNERVALRTSRPDVRPALARVIERASDPLPGRRYENVDALARDLAALQRRPGHVRLRYTLAGIAAVLVLVLVASEVHARLTGDDRSFRDRLVIAIAGTPSPVEDPIIVVLPFKNLSSEPGSRLLVDSLTAGLIQQLGIINGLKVRFQQSSFKLRDKPRDLAAFGKQLGANLAVDGDVRFSGGKLVINASLLPTAGGDSLWKDILTRKIESSGDLTEVSSEIARTIVNKLRLTLGPTQRRYSTDIVTYEKYLRACELRDMRLTRAAEAIPLFEEVIRRDPSYAPAMAALAATYAAQTIAWPNARGFGIPPSEASTRMAPLIARALEIDSMLAEAHAAKASMHALAGRWVEAEVSFRRAIANDPTMSSAYGDFVLSTLEPWGRIDDALSTLQAALDNDRLSLDLRNLLGRIQRSAGQYDEALANCQSVVAEDADFPFAEENCARTLVAMGRTAEALDLFNKRFDLNEGWIGYVYAITGRRADAEAIAARSLKLPHRQALIYAGLGDKDRAFEALERIAALNPGRAGSYLTYTELAPLRGDPRVAALRRKMGFPQPN